MALTLTELQDGIAFWNTKTKWNRNDTFHHLCKQGFRGGAS